MTDSELVTIDAILDGVGSGANPPGLEVPDTAYVLEATFGEMAPVIAIVRAHKAAIADNADHIHYWVKVYLAMQGARRRH